jgi:hypothetical protein
LNPGNGSRLIGILSSGHLRYKKLIKGREMKEREEKEEREERKEK